MVQSHGGDASFERFFENSKDDIFRSILLITRDRALAEDASAEAFTRAFERWAEVADHPSPTAWAARTALNYVRSDRRRSWRFSSDLPEVPFNDGAPEDPQLVALLLRLPKRQREVVALRVLLDLSTERTADLLGIAAGTVTAHLFKALARLARELEETTIKEVEG